MKKTSLENKGYIISILSTSALALVPSFVSAQSLTWLDNMITEVETVVGNLVPVLVALALALFIWGVVLFIAKSGDEKSRDEGKQKMIWGIVALFVIISVWGLVNLLQEITGIDGAAGSIAPPAIL